MAKSNFERLVQLADEVFAVKNDPSQLDVNDKVISKLKQMHPATLSSEDSGDGPVAWILVIPTTMELMNKFLNNEITEKELFQLTPAGIVYEALYLCSALVLKEYQRKGISKKLLLEAIDDIRKDHPLQCLFVWPFSKEGDRLAETIAGLTKLPLYKKEEE